MSIYVGKVPVREANEWHSCQRLRTSLRLLKRACLKAPAMAFMDFDKPFLLETNASKLGLGAVLSQKQADGWYHLVVYASHSLTTHEHNYHSMKQEFLVLKWAIAKQFHEYLLWKLFIVRTKYNLLTYNMTTPNLDTTRHWWIESLAWFTFSIEYQKGCDNVAADALSQVTLKLNAETVKSILDGVAMGTTKRADIHDSVVAKADEVTHQPFQETAILAWAACVDLHVTDWVTAQQEDWPLKATIKWISGQKVQDLKHLLGDDTNTEVGKTILQEQKKLMLYQGALYHCHIPTGKLEEVLWFVVPKAHWVATMNGCHHNAGHQGQQWTLHLLNDQFWWPGKAAQIQRAISSCKQCIQHEGIHAKAPMWLIIVTTPLKLLHVDFASIETMMELDQPPNVMKLLVFCDHFTKHVMAYMTPSQLQKTVDKLLWQGYVSIFGTLAKLLSNWGANFESNIIRQLCKLMGIYKVRTLPYHAQTNGQEKQAHQMLMHMIVKLSKDQKADWLKHLPELVHAYNSMKWAITGYSPHYFMFRCQPCLPINFYFPHGKGYIETPACWPLCFWVVWKTVGGL